MDRDRLAAALLAPVIAFAFVFGAIGLHRWYGIARALITLIVVIWIVAYDTTKRDWLPGLSQTTRGLLRLGATGLLGVEIGRIVVLMTKDGFAVGDLIAILIDLIVFGYLLQGALVALGKTPGQGLYDAAVRARATDPERALKLATRATTLYRKWDEAWVLRAGIVGAQHGQHEQVLILKQSLKYCPRSKEIRDVLISSMYATGATEGAEIMLSEYREMFPRSARPILIDAANAISRGAAHEAKTHLTDALDRARKERDYDGLIKVARLARLLDEDQIARGAIEAAITGDPGNRRLQVMLGILVETDEPARALALFDQARASWRQPGTFEDFLAAERRYLDPNMG
jgi:hypothetical protein